MYLLHSPASVEHIEEAPFDSTCLERFFKNWAKHAPTLMDVIKSSGGQSEIFAEKSYWYESPRMTWLSYRGEGSDVDLVGASQSEDRIGNRRPRSSPCIDLEVRQMSGLRKSQTNHNSPPVSGPHHILLLPLRVEASGTCNGRPVTVTLF